MLRIFAILLLLSSQVFADPIDDKCPNHVVFGSPVNINTDVLYLCKLGYAVQYSTTYKNPYIVVEQVTKDKVTGTVRRKNNFREDPDVPVGLRATLRDYNGDYDRGHMAPAANFVSSEQMMSESFLLTNIIPQNPNNNRGIWKRLETDVRNKAVELGELYTIQGTIFTAEYKFIGENKVGVPDFVFKVIYNPKLNQAASYLFPNAVSTSKNYNDFSTTIQIIESRTNLILFPTSTTIDKNTVYQLNTWGIIDGKTN